jgi:hypothetical protein
MFSLKFLSSLTLATHIINIGLISLAIYHGVFNEEYAHGSFLLLLVLLNNPYIKEYK